MKLGSVFFGFLVGCLVTVLIMQGAKRKNCVDPLQQEMVVIDSVRTDTVFLRPEPPEPTERVLIEYREIPVHVSDTVQAPSDTVYVALPITQAIYQDSLYKAWVSGFEASIDSIEIYSPIRIETRIITKTETRLQSKKWGLGLQVGAGVAPGKVSPYIGIGVSYNIFSW